MHTDKTNVYEYVQDTEGHCSTRASLVAFTACKYDVEICQRI